MFIVVFWGITLVFVTCSVVVVFKVVGAADVELVTGVVLLVTLEVVAPDVE